MNNIEYKMTNQMTAEKLRDKITVDSITKEIEDGWTNPFFIAEHIVGTDAWRSLPEWDQKILVARVHKIATEDKNLRKRYFS